MFVYNRLHTYRLQLTAEPRSVRFIKRCNYIWICIYTYSHTYLNMHYMHLNRHTYIYIYLQICRYVCMHQHACIHIVIINRTHVASNPNPS